MLHGQTPMVTEMNVKTSRSISSCLYSWIWKWGRTEGGLKTDGRKRFFSQDYRKQWSNACTEKITCRAWRIITLLCGDGFRRCCSEELAPETESAPTTVGRLPELQQLKMCVFCGKSLWRGLSAQCDVNAAAPLTSSLCTFYNHHLQRFIYWVSGLYQTKWPFLLNIFLIHRWTRLAHQEQIHRICQTVQQVHCSSLWQLHPLLRELGAESWSFYPITADPSSMNITQKATNSPCLLMACWLSIDTC